MAQTWSTRGAATAAGVTRAMVRTAAEIGLIDGDNITLVDLVNMKANSLVRGMSFPGEQRAAHLSRSPLLAREERLAEAVRKVVAGDKRDAWVLFHATHVTVANDSSALNAQTQAAATMGEPFVALPVGQWLAEMADERAGSP
jgi:hypothetical protein